VVQGREVGSRSPTGNPVDLCADSTGFMISTVDYILVKVKENG
jgi:hypothetical protein